MGASKHQTSIFSQTLDRVAFIAYFLGAVVPLAALGVVLQRYALPAVDDPYVQAALVGSVVFVAILSFAAFLILRRTTGQTLRRMDRDNDRLETLLEASTRLSTAPDGRDAAAVAARCALTATESRATFVLLRGEPQEPLQLVASAGKNAVKLHEARARDIDALAKLALSEGRPAVRGPGGGGATAAAVPIPGEGLAQGVLVALHETPGREIEPPHLGALSTLAGLASVALRNSHLHDAQRNFFTHVTDILVTAIDENLGYNRGHGQRVAQLANRIGRTLELDDTRLQRLHFGALLHDLGMVKFDRALHKDPQACQKHTVLGHRMLSRITLWQDVAPIVHHHHEWYDGNGYPEGLAGERIPLEARVVAVADAWDTMTSSASYKIALSFEHAVKELRRGAGTQFDPQVVKAFLHLVEQGVVAPEHMG